jgi:hypothetical protein
VSDHSKKDSATAFERDATMIPTSELLKFQRKKSYEEAKAKRKAQKKADKLAKAEERSNARQQKDQELWASLTKASALSKDDEE